MGSPSVTSWLLEADPAIRWQVMRDLTAEPAETVAGERLRVATDGWGVRLLGLQGDDGQWGGGAYTPKWTSTTYTLLQLRDLGIDPEHEATNEAIGLVRDGVVMRQRPFFAYIGETCVTGIVLALAAYFDESRDTTDDTVGWLLGEQLEDGGWNCQTVAGSKRSSFHTTILVLEGLLEYEAANGAPVAEVGAARSRAHEYLLERRMFRSLGTGEVVNSRWLLFSFPPRWHYDVLRGLDYLRAAAVPPDKRCAEAIEVVESKRSEDGRWPLQHHYPGKEHFSMEEGSGKPSRWNTLRALRVLDWYRGA